MEVLCLDKTDDASSFYEDEEPTAPVGAGCSADANRRSGAHAGLIVIAFAIGTLARVRRRRARP